MLPTWLLRKTNAESGSLLHPTKSAATAPRAPTPVSLTAAALRDVCQSLTTQVVQAFSRVVMPAAAPPPGGGAAAPAPSLLHPCMHRQGSVAISQLGGAGT